MPFFNFSKSRAVLAAVSLFILLSAAAAGNDLEPLEDVTKLEKPTISYRAEGGVYLIDWDGQNNRLWLKGEYGLPIWSMDGKRVSVAGGVPDKFYGKYVLNLRTGEEANITKRIIQTMGIDFWREFDILSSEWMPGGRQMACVVGGFFLPPHGPPRELYMLTISTGKMVNITNTPGKEEGSLTVSPDGKIAFSANAKEPFHHTHKRDIFTMNTDGTDVRNITNTSDSSEQAPVWSPDGKKIAFLGLGGVYTMNPDGSNMEKIAPLKGWVELTTWSPDSKWILYGMNPDFERFGFQSGFRIFRVNVDTKEIVRVTPEGVNTMFGSWVLAGRSRFLSVDPADKKKAQWGKIKAAEPTAPQKTTADAE
ncbi:MAG: hypothetical protein OXT69_06815 [Candidatus Poribacteria bacterium]|nr:hypothetical protein [Candidatus Poribacteria bacterium]